VSPILSTQNSEHKNELSQLIAAIIGTNTDHHGAFITNQCGFHVHIEAPKNFEVIKELAILLLVFEEEISRLHPPCRRPGHTASVGQCKVILKFPRAKAF
jgi:hypothetical protein